MNEEKIKEIFSDKAFVTELISLEAPAEIQALLKTKGIDLDLEQIEKGKEMVAEKLAQFASGEDVFDDEIGDEDLGKVSGGAVTLTFVIVQAIVVGVCTGIHEVHQVTRGRW
jgi:hypothetical protein